LKKESIPENAAFFYKKFQEVENTGLEGKGAGGDQGKIFTSADLEF